MAVFDPDKVRRLQLYRAAQSSPPSPRGTPKTKPSQAEPKGRYLRRSEPVFNMRKAAGLKNARRRGRGGGETGQKVKGSPGSVAGESERASISLEGIESPASTPIRYWPLVPLGQGVGDISRTDLVAVTSSPSSMHLSSDISQRLSISSQESLARGLSSPASGAARRKLFLEGRTSTHARSNDALEIPSDLPQSQGEIVEVHANEPHLEITSFHSDDAVMDTTMRCSTSFLDRNNPQQPNPVVAKRSRMSAKVTDKVGSPLRVFSDNNNQEGAAAEKGRVLQASHPILDKLRKSWGLALQAKHRHNAVAAILSDAGSDTSAENSGEFRVDSNVIARKKWDQLAEVQSEVTEQAEHLAEVATTEQPPDDEREALIRNIITRERRAAITKQQLHLLQQQPPQPLKLIMDAEVLSKSNNSSAPGAAKAGLARIQANCQRPKPELPSKFKKQYLHADPSMSKSLAMQRGNKENVQLELKVPAPPTGFAWKRKPPVPTRRQLSPRNLGTTAVNGVRGVPPQAAARATAAAHAHHAVSTTQTTPPAENLVVTSSSDNSGLLCTSTTKLGGPLDAADASGPKGETALRKVNDAAILEGTVSTSSMLKLTKQKSDYKTSSTSVKEAITSPVGAKACEHGTVLVADESDITAAKDRRSNAVLQYEPRLHSVRAIKKWESTSGKRYYDLSPIERQKVNQEISAASPRAAPAPKRRVCPTSNSVRLRLN